MGTSTQTDPRTGTENGNTPKCKGGFGCCDVPKCPNVDIWGTENGNCLKLSCIIATQINQPNKSEKPSKRKKNPATKRKNKNNGNSVTFIGGLGCSNVPKYLIGDVLGMGNVTHEKVPCIIATQIINQANK